MYQSVIRDPGGNGLIRIQPDVCGQYSAVVNGSILIVPPGTTAFVAINGILSHPYGPGRYEIFTGVDPFFVRLRNIMTHGDSGTTVSVFFVSTEKSAFVTLGTGEFPFREHRFNITMKALASCRLSFSISDPMKILEKLVGTYNSVFSEEDIDPCIEQMVLTPVREAISREVSQLDITEFNSRLSHISSVSESTIRAGLMEYGIRLHGFTIVAINIPDTEIDRLHTLEQEYANGKTRTDLELDNLRRIWKGNINARTMGEMMTGFPSRGQTSSGVTGANSSGCDNDLPTMMLRMMILSQLLPTMRESLTEMARQSDMLGGQDPSVTHRDRPSDGPHPPVPARYKRCPSCNENVERNQRVCPYCGFRFDERNE